MRRERAVGLFGLLALAVLLARPLCAQSPDTVIALPEARVEATRTSAGAERAPLGVTVRRFTPTDRLLDPGAGLAPTLRSLPGLYLANRENPALGERLIVRGMGYRSAFGVRGVQVVLDGIPLTLPDGQSVLTIVDPAWIRRAELVRGPASALWGNGSGGVLFLSTLPEERRGASVLLSGGSNGFRRVEAEGVTHLSRGLVGAAASHSQSDGYRDHSGFETTRVRGFWSWWGLPSSTTLRLVAAFENTPRQQHPGALTAAELATDRRRAEARYVDSRSGKASRQGQIGVLVTHTFPRATWTTSLFGQTRHLDNPLPFAYIDLDRRAGGGRTALEGRTASLAWTIGLDAGIQRDVRANAPNLGGSRGAVRTLDQTETVTQAALWGRASWTAAALDLPDLLLEGTIRADRLHFRAEDALQADGDQSGARTLGALSPMLGASYGFRGAKLYASWATAFETPTTTELANRPDGSGGFNFSLAPQRTRGVEVGMRCETCPLAFDIALYAFRVRDGLVPFEGADGRTYYENAQTTRHAGVELATEWRPLPELALSAMYSAARLRLDAEDTRSTVLPGVPAHRFVLALRALPGRWVADAALETRAAYYADDANTARVAPATVVDVGLAYTLPLGPAALAPYLRLANALDARYVSSIALNARGGRYYEPAAERQVFMGLRLAW